MKTPIVLYAHTILPGKYVPHTLHARDHPGPEKVTYGSTWILEHDEWFSCLCVANCLRSRPHDTPSGPHDEAAWPGLQQVVDSGLERRAQGKR
jgi:hypothetical protein